MNPYTIKRIIYHFNWSAKLYSRFRAFRHSRSHKLSDEEFAKREFKKATGRELDLQNPQTYDEKVWFLKLYDRDSLLTRCTDKVSVRSYVRECGLEHILNECYEVYKSVWDIDFKNLPDSCFFKCNHTSGTNLLYDKNKEFDKKYFCHEFDFWMHWDYYWNGREWNYKNIARRVVAERVLRDRKGNLPMDYKFFCFGGEVKFLSLDIGVADTTGEHSKEYYRNIYDTNFECIPVTETRKNYPGSVTKPVNFEKMLEYATILSKPFVHARVDLYNVDGRIYFGEITFHHGGGCNDFQPEEFARTMGDWIDLETIKRRSVRKA